MKSTPLEMEVVAGTYENFLVGFHVKAENDENVEPAEIVLHSERSFTNNSHSGAITALANIGKYLVSGSTDEVIRIINMDARIEHGSLQQQSGTITCLESFDKDYLFSGSEDGTICIWKSGSWLCEKTLRAHEGGVIDLSIHPSGKLALSVGKDKSLKTWNLIKGRSGFITNLKGIADAVKWSKNGTFYAVSISSRVDVYCIQTAKIVYTIPFGKRASKIVFATDNILLVAGDKEEIEVHSVSSKSKLCQVTAHKARVKDITVPVSKMLVSASNDGFIKFWQFDDETYSSVPTLIHEINTTCRITCLTCYST